MQAGWIEATPRENVVHEIAVNASIPVLERVDIDESKREHRCSYHRVEIVLCAMVEGDQPGHKGRNIFMPRADMVWNRPLRIAVMLADEATLLAKAELHEALVADHDALQAKKLLLVERHAARLTDGAAPPLDTILRWPFTFDHIAGLRIFQQQKCSRPRQQVLRNLADDRTSALLPVLRDEFI